MTKAVSSVLTLLLSAALFACGPGALVPGGTEPPQARGSAVDIGSGQLELGFRLASLRGQNLVSVELDKRHQRAEAMLAVERARRYARAAEAAAGGARAHFLRLDLELAFASRSLRRVGEGGAFAEALATAGTTTLEIESEIVGKTARLAAYKATIVVSLVDEAAILYEGAVEGPFDPEDYRAAYGSLREAENIHEGLATVLEENTNDEARAADILLAAIFGAMPSADPPIRLLPADEVAADAYMLGVLLADKHGAMTPPSGSLAPPHLYIALLLEEVLGSFESGETGVADVLLEKVRASLCCPATSAGDALETELALLSNAIRSGAADSDVETLVERSSELAEDSA
ncbi:MAG TPA: hypothetical protein VFF07_07075 [Actinomycetota bacterium]|nr:hypothetical protein [Actinomycetota bacterium]